MEADKLVELRRVSGSECAAVEKLKLPLLPSVALTVGGQNKWPLATSLLYKSRLFRAPTHMRVEP